MRVHNTTNIPDDLIREIVRFVRPSGISNFDVEIRNSQRGLAGRAYHQGSGYHERAVPFIVARVGQKFPIKTAGHSAYIETWLGNRIEGLVFLLAHELRHLWQAANPLKGKRNGMVYGSRGRFSERDADAYAIHKLREWRRR